MTLESAPGVGSEFRIVLEFGLASADAVSGQEASPAAAGERALPGVRVLVVDE